jgi:hypothetical protein
MSTFRVLLHYVPTGLITHTGAHHWPGGTIRICAAPGPKSCGTLRQRARRRCMPLVVDAATGKLSFHAPSASPPALGARGPSFRPAARTSGSTPSRSGAADGAGSRPRGWRPERWVQSASAVSRGRTPGLQVPAAGAVRRGAKRASDAGGRGDAGGREAKRAATAAARRAAADKRPFDSRYLKRRSVTELTYNRYAYWTGIVVAWAAARRMALTTVALADAAIEGILNELFFSGDGVYVGRMILYGFAFMYDMPSGGSNFSRSKRALKGWARAAPEHSRDPAPWVAVMLLVRRMVESFGAEGLEASRCSVVAYDLFARPSEMLGVTYMSLVPPAADVHHKLDHFAVVFAPSNGRGPSANPLPPAKSGEYDATVLACDAASIAAGRGVVRRVLDCLKSRGGNSRRPVFGSLTLARWESLLKQASDMEGISHLDISPHTLRHGGASHDMALQLRSFPQVQSRGRWLSKKSVARYGKFGMYQRQLAKLSASQRREGAVIARSLARFLSV